MTESVPPFSRRRTLRPRVSPPRRSRRALLATAAGALTTGVAGCAGPFLPETDPTPTDRATATETPASVDGRWPTYQFDAANTGRNPTARELRRAPTVRWTADGGTSQPVVGDGRVYVGGRRVTALDAATGDRRWRVDTRDAGGVALLGDRVVTTALVESATSPTAGTPTDDREVALLGLDRDGTEVWRVPAGEAYARGLVTDGERAYLPSGTSGKVSADVYGTVSASLLAVERDGTVAWRRTEDVPPPTTPAVGDAVYLPTSRAVVAVDAETGTDSWVYRSTGANDDGPVTVFRTPTLVDRTLYVGGRDGVSGAVVALDADAVDRAWRVDPEEGPRRAVGVADGVVVAGTRLGRVNGFTTDGERAWQTTVGTGVVTAPTVVGDTAYVASGARLAALSVSTGDRLWQVDLPGRAAAAPVAVGSTLFVNTEGPLVALGPGDA